MFSIKILVNYAYEWTFELSGISLYWIASFPKSSAIPFCQVSSLEIERICSAVDENILETAAVGVPPAGGGPEKLVIAVVFKDSDNLEHKLVNLMISFNTALQRKLNPLFKVYLRPERL